MKLLLITNLFPTPSEPERGIFTFQLAKRLKKHCDLTIVCPLPWFPNWPFLPIPEKYRQLANTPVRYEIDGITVHSPKYLLIPKLAENYHARLMYLGIKRYIFKIHNQVSFDIINSHWLFPDSVATAKIAKKLKVPHIATGCGCDVNQDIYKQSKGEDILTMLTDATAITVKSNSLKHVLIENHISEEKITVISNGVDVNQFMVLDKEGCRKQLSINTKFPVILYVGRLSEEKNVGSLLNAIALLKADKIFVQLYLIGEGIQKEYLSCLVIKLGIQDFIHFVGRVDHDDIGIWMGATDYFCLPSLREGCPNVILEALGCGVPVLASKVGAIPDVVTKETGILFSPTNVEDIANSIKQAVGTKWSADSISASVNKLSWEHAANQYYEVFEKSINL